MSQRQAAIHPAKAQYPIPSTEVERLQILQKSGFLASSEDPVYDHIVRIAKMHFDVPVALVSIIGKDKQVLKGKAGTELCATSRKVAFCSHAIMSNDVTVVHNASKDPLFANNPLVTEAPHVRFYAGAPIIIPDGIILGTICILDTKPRPVFTLDDKQMLKELASVAAYLVERQILGDLVERKDTRPIAV